MKSSSRASNFILGPITNSACSQPELTLALPTSTRTTCSTICRRGLLAWTPRALSLAACPRLPAVASLLLRARQAVMDDRAHSLPCTLTSLLLADARSHGRQGRARPRRVPAAQPFLFPSRQCHHIPLTTPPLPHSPIGHATPRSAAAACPVAAGYWRPRLDRLGPPPARP